VVTDWDPLKRPVASADLLPEVTEHVSGKKIEMSVPGHHGQVFVTFVQRAQPRDFWQGLGRDGRAS
jgi:hypothetical protein